MQRAFPPRLRGMLALRRYPNGKERCIVCKLCEAVCPALAITIESAGRGGRRGTTSMRSSAIYCGFCEESCPVDAIVLTRNLEYHMAKRHKSIFCKAMLHAVGDASEKQIAEDRKADAAYRLTR